MTKKPEVIKGGVGGAGITVLRNISIILMSSVVSKQSHAGVLLTCTFCKGGGHDNMG